MIGGDLGCALIWSEEGMFMLLHLILGIGTVFLQTRHGVTVFIVTVKSIKPVDRMAESI